MRWLFLLCFALPLPGQILRCGDVGCMTNPMTTLGDIITGGASGTPTRLGASTGYLHWNGTAFVYDTPPAGAQQVTSDPSGSCTVGVSLQYNNTNGKLWGCDAGTWTQISGGSGGTVSCGPGASVLCTVAGSNTQLDVNPAIVPYNVGSNGIQTGGSPIVCVDSSSSSTAYRLACGQPAPPYTTNQTMFCFFNTTNSTTTPTAALDTRGALTIVNGDGTTAVASTIKPGLPYTCSYDGTHLRLAELGLGGGGGATIAVTTSTIKGDGAGNAVAVTGTGSNCVHVDGSSAACGGGGTFSVCFDFRGTVAGASSSIPTGGDGACTWILDGSSTGTNGAYPTTRTVNGALVTFGWESGASGVIARDRYAIGVGGMDVRLSGVNVVSNTGTTPAVFRIDLPAAGAYRYRWSMSDPGNNSCVNMTTVEDTSTVIKTLSVATTDGSVSQATDANGIVWPLVWQLGTGIPITNLLASNTASYGIWSTTIFRLAVGGASGTGLSCLEHLVVESAPVFGF